MVGDKKVIEYLQEVLMNELTAVNQYFLHARMFESWGITKLGKSEYEQSIDEMRDADLLIHRILFLDGLPNLQRLGKLLIGQDVREMLDCDLQFEHQALPVLRKAVAYCEEVDDYVSRQLFSEILKGEEAHVDWLETQFHLIEKMGLENYVHLQSEPETPE